MTVGKNYDGSKVAPRIDPDKKTIRVTQEWLRQNVKNISPEMEIKLRDEISCWVICPAIFYFNDTEEVRRILGIDTEKKDALPTEQAL